MSDQMTADPAGTTASVIRSVALVRRSKTLDWAEFSRHWREEHAAIARGLPGMVGYTQGHAIPGEQPVDRPPAWGYDGVPLASFPDLAAIGTLRAHPDYHGRAVPDEARFTDRSSMAAVLLAHCFGEAPAPAPEGRTLMVFARTGGADERAGRALAGALSAVPGAGSALGRRWSTALDADPGLSPRGAADRPYDGLLEVWFPSAAPATRTAQAVAADPALLPVEVFCLVVRENRVV
ncbi:EthD domain-containing protein [Streptomyces hirsutus]|uniref:EthD domain-containing protein n=1 Tax=Streptomyces hirsutus TaxID=35620 RepID=A0ABZ1GEP1_9ACTN|nr:EthD domain-containing protein [Streptomyces hirsutus]WSD04582.1 EthD domain-containing protein [Streptomyces hirsutus]WTD22027.1 EthD domain-containing protein [Streptomyces hirsutus]